MVSSQTQGGRNGGSGAVGARAGGAGGGAAGHAATRRTSRVSHRARARRSAHRPARRPPCWPHTAGRPGQAVSPTSLSKPRTCFKTPVAAFSALKTSLFNTILNHLWPQEFTHRLPSTVPTLIILLSACCSCCTCILCCLAGFQSCRQQ